MTIKEAKELLKKLEKLEGDEFSQLVLDKCNCYEGTDEGIAVAFTVEGEEKFVVFKFTNEDLMELAKDFGVADEYYGFLEEDKSELDEANLFEAQCSFYGRYEDKIDSYYINYGKCDVIECLEELISKAEKWEE